MTQKAEPRDFSAFLLDQSQGRTHSEPLLEEEVPSDDGITDAQSRALHASLRGVGSDTRCDACSRLDPRWAEPQLPLGDADSEPSGGSTC